MHTKRPWRLAAPALAVAAVALFAAGCGDDEEDSEPASIAIEATGSGKQVKFTAPAEVDAGAAEIEFTNSTEQETDAQLLKIEGEYSEQQVIAEIGKAIEGQPVSEWLQAAGGVGATKPGETKTMSQELDPGTYYIVGQDRPRPPLTKITVIDDGGAELEEPEAKVTAREYAFSGEGLKAGQDELLLENAGDQWHHFIFAPIAEGKTIEDVKAFVESEGAGGPPQGPPPIDEAAQFQSTVIEGGDALVVQPDLVPGKYAFLCFISDKKGGPSHVAKGMVSEVTVEE